MGLYSFILDNKPTTGSVETSAAAKRKFSKESLSFNVEGRTKRSVVSSQNMLICTKSAKSNERRRPPRKALTQTENPKREMQLVDEVAR